MMIYYAKQNLENYFTQLIHVRMMLTMLHIFLKPISVVYHSKGF